MTDLLLNRSPQPSTSAIRRETVGGVAYLVAPIVSAREGVMNGILYPATELAASANAWNGVPTPLGHPVDSAGRFMSAANVASPGLIAASEWREGGLRHEVRLNEALAPAELLARLLAGEMIEVSTGLYAEIEPASGLFNGAAYAGIARNIRPDHIAILLHERGACSRDDGCGFPRANSQQEESMPDQPAPDTTAVRVHLELTLDEAASRVYYAWGQKYDYAGEMRDIYPDRLVVRHNGRLMQYGYRLDAEGQCNFDEPVEVEYTPLAASTDPGGNPSLDEETGEDHPVGNAQQGNWLAALRKFLFNSFTEEAHTMDRQKLIQTLVANERNLLSQASLEALPDTELAAYAEQLKPPCAKANAQQPAPAVTAAQFEALVNSVTALTAQIQANADREKSGLAEAILAHTDAWSQTELLAMDTPAVMKIHRAIVPADYSGRGVANSAVASEWEPYTQEAN